MNQSNTQPNIDLQNTTAIISPDGNQLFAEGVILRKVSKFVTGTAENGILPIPVFYDVKTGEILIDTLPKALRGEFTDEDVDAE